MSNHFSKWMKMSLRGIAFLTGIFTRHRRLWFWLAVAAVSLFCLTLLLLPHGIRWAAQRSLRQFGIKTAVVKAVEFNPFSGRLAVYSVFKIETIDRRLNVGRTEVQLDWRPLLKHRLSISGFTIEDVFLDVVRAPDGTLSIGGLAIKPPAPTTAPAPAGRPWEVSIGAVDLHNVTVSYRDPRVQGVFAVRDAHVDPLDSARPDRPTDFALAMGVNGGNVRVRGATRPFMPETLTTAHTKCRPFAAGVAGRFA